MRVALWCGLPRRRPLSDAALRGQVESRCSGCVGSVKVNVLPWPSSLSTVRLPPWSSTKRREMARPDLCPPGDETFRPAGTPRRCGLDQRVRCRPVITHADQNFVAVATSADARHDHLVAVNFKALVEQVEEHLLEHPLVRVNDADVRVDVELSAMLWRVARSRDSATEFCTTSESAKGVSCRSIRPASILERSRMSLISVKQMAPRACGYRRRTQLACR